MIWKETGPKGYIASDFPVILFCKQTRQTIQKSPPPTDVNENCFIFWFHLLRMKDVSFSQKAVLLLLFSFAGVKCLFSFPSWWLLVITTCLSSACQHYYYAKMKMVIWVFSFSFGPSLPYIYAYIAVDLVLLKQSFYAAEVIFTVVYPIHI